MSVPAANRLLHELHRRGVELVANGDRLRYSPKSAVTVELHDQIVRHKPELLALLRTPVVAGDSSKTDHKRSGTNAEPRPCYCCGSREFWALAHVLHWVCAGCHEPDRAREELRWINVISNRDPAAGGAR
jgi:hypothetical protein